VIRSVVFSPAAAQQLSALNRFLTVRASALVANRYVTAIVRHCESLGRAPELGTPRPDIRPGLRTTHDKGRVVIAYGIGVAQVSIYGVFYGGQNHEAILRADQGGGALPR